MAADGASQHLRTARVARRRTRGSSPASRSAPPNTGAGSCRRATAGRRGSPPRPPRPPRGCSRRGRPRAGRRGASPSSASSSYDHSIVARSVRWRSGASRAPPVNSGSRCSSRSRIWAGESAFTRAAASSSASGRSSRRRQISATAIVAAEVRFDRPRPRQRRSRRPPDGPSGGTGYSCSPLTWRGSRLVTSRSSLGHAPSSPARSVRRLHHVLEVVEEQQRRGLADVLGQSVPRSDRLPRRLQHERRVAKWSERHPEDTAGIALRRRRGRLQREPRLPARLRGRSASAGERLPARPARAPHRSSRSRPRKGVAGMGRFVRCRLLSGGKSPSPSW